MKKIELTPVNPDNEHLKQYSEDVKKGEAWRRGYLQGVAEERKRIQEDVQSVLNFLDGITEREQIANFVKAYLLESK